MKVRFPDGSHKPVTTIRATYRLPRANWERVWIDDNWAVQPVKHPKGIMMHVNNQTENGSVLMACLEHMGDGQGYGGGAWPDGVATAFTVKRDGEALVLELWDVDATEPGPWFVPGIDG